MLEKEKAGSMKRVSECFELPEYTMFKIDIHGRNIISDNGVMHCDSLTFYPASELIADKIKNAEFTIWIGKDTIKIGVDVFAVKLQWQMDSELEAVDRWDSVDVMRDFGSCHELQRVAARRWEFVALGLFTVYARQVIQ